MPRQALAFALAFGAIAVAGAAQARITEVRIDAVEPFAEGQAFGEVGSYLRITGVAKGELDPFSPQNKVIVDLDKAPRNARGMVEYEVDIFVLRPADPARGNGLLFYEVLNRGNKQIGQRLHDLTVGGAAAQNDPRTRAHAGNGFLFERGYTVVWSGWDPDVSKGNATMGAGLPVAMEDGRPLARRIREEIQVGKRRSADVEAVRLGYPAVSTDKDRAQLTVRARASDPRVVVPPQQWEFADARSIRLLPKGTKFTPISIYELWYEATEAKVLGIGFAATRDLVSFVRYERADDRGTANPLVGEGGGIRHAVAFGGSQSGRYLRHFIELGMNKDTRGRRVFEGMFAHTAGAGKVFANHTFGEPGRTFTQHEDHDYPENWFPFSTASTIDKLAGKTGALFRGDGFDPLLIETNTSTEYWQKGASLLTTDPAGGRDLSLPDTSRVYLIAGTQHGGRAGLDSRPGACANPTNPMSPGPALRALVVALEQWVTKGIAPPASRVPSISAGDGGRVCGRAHAADQGIGAAARRQPDRAAGGLDQSARNPHRDSGDTGRALLRHARLGGRSRRQRGGRHPAAADRRAARHPYRLERVSAATRGVVRSRRLLCAVRQDQGRARDERRPAPVARGALRLARRLRGEAQGRGRCAGRRAAAAAGGRRRLCEGGGDERSVLRALARRPGIVRP